MSHFRRCSRPGCGKPAVATLTYAYADSTAVVGPLAAASEPHTWDLCEHHAARITAPLGWELLRVEDITIHDDDDDLTALAKAVREVGGHAGDLLDDGPVRHPSQQPKAPAPRTRRGHLSIVPDPIEDTPS
ncbi:DUF3499 domain-containing protein [Corynebacterium sp. 13CS0277]|uniref:DUF3499 domain-containing protein n=1 Tax=Corynebacterium sp. 13CS0277 TaxID=2071994 RepID=UPI000D03AC31|nr:DUF3499 domain-containing protein [Corynebacterium sp. 13CS0277]PRQ10812.1 DUF3499 domain-containing protein [Corynebacterium sp. 13CS0277]